MSATRVRVCFEFRNGDGNFLRHERGEYVSLRHEMDLAALESAYLSALREILARSEHSGVTEKTGKV